jgi:hypothetical protein
LIDLLLCLLEGHGGFEGFPHGLLDPGERHERASDVVMILGQLLPRLGHGIHGFREGLRHLMQLEQSRRELDAQAWVLPCGPGSIEQGPGAQEFAHGGIASAALDVALR